MLFSKIWYASYSRSKSSKNNEKLENFVLLRGAELLIHKEKPMRLSILYLTRLLSDLITIKTKQIHLYPIGHLNPWEIKVKIFIIKKSDEESQNFEIIVSNKNIYIMCLNINQRTTSVISTYESTTPRLEILL